MGKVSRRIATCGVSLLAVVGMGIGGAAAVGSSSVGTPRTSGPEHVTIIETSSSGGPVFLRGLVNDAGVDNESADGTTSDFVLSQGTISVAHESTENGGNFVPNPITCLARLTDAGTFTVNGGTGAYSGVSGSGTYTARGTLLFPRTSEGCNFNADPISTTIVVNAIGTLRLGVVSD